MTKNFNIVLSTLLYDKVAGTCSFLGTPFYSKDVFEGDIPVIFVNWKGSQENYVLVQLL